MREREKRLDDYGLSRNDVKKIKKYCLEHPDSVEPVRYISERVNEQIACALVKSICVGASFDDLDVYITEKDFYGYRRKCLSLIKKMMIENGMW